MHPSDSDLDRYAAARLGPADHQAVRKHAARCRACGGRIAQCLALLAGRRYLHLTDEGPLIVELKRLDAKIAAILRGGTVDVQRSFATAAGARKYALRAFSELHPEHLCGRHCRAE